MSKTFDPTKPVQTRDGRKARILATDLDNHCGNIVAAVSVSPTSLSSSKEVPAVYYSDGRFSSITHEPSDLINIPEKISRWHNVFADGGTCVFATRAAADKSDIDAIVYGGPRRVACVLVEVTEGDGL